MHAFNHSPVVFMVRDAGQEQVLEHALARLLIGRREDHLLLTIAGVPRRTDIEFVIGDADALRRQLSGAPAEPIAMLLRMKDEAGVPISAGGYLSVERLDEYSVIHLRAMELPHGSIELVLHDVAEVIDQLRAVAPSCARPIGAVLRRRGPLFPRHPRKA